MKHSVVIDEKLWSSLSSLSQKEGKSVQELVHQAIEDFLESYELKKRIQEIPYVDDDENEELTRSIDLLTPEDLEIVKVEEVDLEEGKD